MNIETVFTTLLVALSTWLTPTPTHSLGLIVSYGPDYILEANADYRGYDLSYYRERCALSAISPSDLGKIVWVKTPLGWYGPCLAVDVGARHDFYTLVYRNKEIAEVGNRLREMMGFKNGQWGEIYVGLCPPAPGSVPVRYKPHLRWSNEGYLSWRNYPEQELPARCDGWGDGIVYGGAQ